MVPKELDQNASLSHSATMNKVPDLAYTNEIKNNVTKTVSLRATDGGIQGGPLRVPNRELQEITINTIGRNSLVDLTNETFEQALFSGVEKMRGYAIYGTKGLVGRTYNRNIFLLEQMDGKSLSGFRNLIKGMEQEAFSSGANKISIYGSSVINDGFLNPNIASRFGYSFEKSASGILLQKSLRN
ncbi:hypothetical protein [Myroides odoratus]|uniref:hypothetical protein n=1 Tax=Myroides odoratus TaxID=256 RepID=UPI0039AF74B9